MIENLKISLLQLNLAWQNPSENHRLIERYFTLGSDLLVLPEMFSTGFTRDYTEQAPYPSLAWMQDFAKNHQTHIYGSLAITENQKALNRGYWVSPDQQIQFYDKKHLFKYGKEHHTFSAGDKIIQPLIDNWTFRPLICYDLRFPVWARNTSPHYDVLIYIASWPELRRSAWINLLKARAIENQCYVIGVNRTGKDGYNLNYSGDSLVIDFTAEIVLDAGSEEGIFETSLSFKDLRDFRAKYPFLEDADNWQFI